jgi:large subunit ribosomal protein L13
MSTTLAKKETVTRKWYILDAAGKPLGRTAVEAANSLRGKHKPDYTPNVDCGDFVIIVNTADAVLTGNKLEQKYYRRHSGWVGGLKETKYKYIMAKRPDFAMTRAVRGMMSKNTRDRMALKRLRVFKGADHIHEAQKPIAWPAFSAGSKV